MSLSASGSGSSSVTGHGSCPRRWRQVGKATFTYGQFLTEALTFLISALVVYYAMVLPVSRLLKLFERNQAATTRDCPECTMSVPVAARRCPECTAQIAPASEQPQMIS